MTYGKRLDKALDAARKSRKELASELRCSPQAVGMVITGTGALSAENSARAARYLRVDAHWLATGEGSMAVGQVSGAASKLSDDALEIAIYFDMLTDKRERTVAYVAAMNTILGLIGEDRILGQNARRSTAAQELPETARTPNA